VRLRSAFFVLAVLGCAPSPRTIARLDIDSAASGGAGGAGEPLPPDRARGRVRVVNGELVSDVGSRLRGVVMAVDVGYELQSPDLVDAIGRDAGLNALHVYLENPKQETGANLEQADTLVDLTAKAGIYLVLGIGGGSMNGSFDIQKIRSFWALYAARYADQRHVIYEIQNNPELTCEDFVKPQTLAMEQEIYELIRAAAPQSHIVLFSGSSLIKPAVMTDLIARLGPFADFSNSSVALHVDTDCTSLTELDTLTSVARSAGLALLISQLPRMDWPAYVQAFEQARVGWIHHGYLTETGTLPQLVEATAVAGLTWCPDFGTFPEDSSQCAEP
jgi:cellulase (glycosyl hydrolase family 5)